MVENIGDLHHFIQFKLHTPDAIKKCLCIKNEELNGQTIHLDKYNSGNFSSIMNTIYTLKTMSYIKMKKNEELNDNLNIFFEKNNRIKETHDKTLAIFNSSLNK